MLNPFKSWGAAVSVAVFAVIASGVTIAKADDVYHIVVKKQEEKKKTRWTLSEWLETRDRMRMMDLWLALHSPSPYEFYLGGHFIQADNQPSPSSGHSDNGWGYLMAAYASIFGLELQKESPTFNPDSNRLIGLFHLRFFGYHAQGTNLTAQLGLRNTWMGAMPAGRNTFRQALAGISGTIYLTQFAGVEGLYRHYFDSTPQDGVVIRSGERYEGGAFIDFKFLRLYGNYFHEREFVRLSSDAEGGPRTGVTAGTKLFF